MNAHNNDKVFIPGSHKSIQGKTITKKTTVPHRPYTPGMSQEAIFALWRLAWFTGQPMTTTLNNLVLQAARQASGQYVCGSCKGSKDQCPGCLFKEQTTQARIVAERPQP